jgi:hypothetical protein
MNWAGFAAPTAVAEIDHCRSSSGCTGALQKRAEPVKCCLYMLCALLAVD